jgi:hypothetical protein
LPFPQSNAGDSGILYTLVFLNRFVPLLVAAMLCTRAVTPTYAAADPVSVDAETARTIEGALQYLASKQSANGSWAIGAGVGGHPVAMTGYCLMAFLASGHVPNEGKYGTQVAKAMQFLVESILPDGLFRGVDRTKYMYNHGIATVALIELYGQVEDPSLRSKIDRLLNVIITGQNSSGGWRYVPNSKDSDISVSVMQVVALRAAKNAGFNVPQETIDRAVGYVKSCNHPASGGFTYQARTGGPGFARTAAAIYSLQVCGLYDDPMVARGAEYIFANKGDQNWQAYGNYYAAPATYMIGGDTWRKWYAHIRGTLLAQAKPEGNGRFWPTISTAGGPIFGTAVAATTLAMPYHYIPLYQR